MDYPYKRTCGAVMLDGETCRFRVWCPNAEKVELILLPQRDITPMERTENGYYQVEVKAQPGQQYVYRLNEQDERPDPVSTYQSETVHGASQVTNPHFDWHDSGWFNLSLRHYIIYELHVGTFTAEGTFDAVIPCLDYLQDLGINAIEIMPVAQFPGGRNWGYDGVLPYAAQNTYGGPEGLKRLVNACHQRGFAVILDVVYNHFGPEGNYLSQFGPYFTERYRSGWGASINFDGAHSDEVRRYFIENALYWLSEFHIDGLRLDATHAIYDNNAVTFLDELTATVHEWADLNNRRVYLIAENDKSDVRLTRPREAGGMGMDAQWLDDLHHVIHALLTGENLGYYEDYHSFEQLVKIYREGFAYSGDYSRFHKRKHGTSSRDVPGSRFVVSVQNHDQIGNRMLGDRLSSLTDFEGLKLAAGAMLLSPYLPMLFMGEEYGETAPFLYFISHGDKDLLEAVRKGRKEEFSYFKWHAEPPDPASEETFNQSKVNLELRKTGDHAILFNFYKTLIQMRKTNSALNNPHKSDLEVWGYEAERVVFLHRRAGHNEAFIAFNFSLDQPATLVPPLPPGRWRKTFDSMDEQWRSSHHHDAVTHMLDSPDGLHLAPKSFVVFTKE